MNLYLSGTIYYSPYLHDIFRIYHRAAAPHPGEILFLLKTPGDHLHQAYSVFVQMVHEHTHTNGIFLPDPKFTKVNARIPTDLPPFEDGPAVIAHVEIMLISWRAPCMVRTGRRLSPQTWPIHV